MALSAQSVKNRPEPVNVRCPLPQTADFRQSNVMEFLLPSDLDMAHFEHRICFPRVGSSNLSERASSATDLTGQIALEATASINGGAEC
jgi:hypothetical protein